MSITASNRPPPDVAAEQLPSTSCGAEINEPVTSQPPSDDDALFVKPLAPPSDGNSEANDSISGDQAVMT